MKFQTCTLIHDSLVVCLIKLGSRLYQPALFFNFCGIFWNLQKMAAKPKAVPSNHGRDAAGHGNVRVGGGELQGTRSGVRIWELQVG